MLAPLQQEALGNLQTEIESLLGQIRHPILVENEIEILDLTAAQWRLNIEFGKLIFSAWNSGKSMSRRIEDFAYRDGSRFGVFVRLPGGRGTTTLEFRELRAAVVAGRTVGRTSFRQRLLAMLEREYRGWKFEHVSSRSDREHSLSTWYTRGLATQGRSGWAFMGLSDQEGIAAADGALAFGLIWLDWLRENSRYVVVSKLKLFLPPTAIAVIAPRLACLNAGTVIVEIYEWSDARASPAAIDLRDYGNVETRLAPRSQAEQLKEAHTCLLRSLLGEAAGNIDIAPDSTGLFSSLRIEGLEVAQIEGQLSPRIFFGLEGRVRKLDDSCMEEFQDFLAEVCRIRRADSPEPQHEYYRLQSERWLESLLLRDITRIDPALSPTDVYSQVPAFSGSDRGIIDLLATTRRGRLAVVELKVHEEINLPLQGLDYWLRVSWLQRRNQFRDFGYFPNCELSADVPLLYLVSPAFRFHSTTQKLLRYFDKRVQVILIGINDSWRSEFKVLFRHQNF